MKIYPSVKPVCDHCRVIRRHGRVVLVHKGSAACQKSGGAS